jgi:hypothetical protein
MVEQDLKLNTEQYRSNLTEFTQSRHYRDRVVNVI